MPFQLGSPPGHVAVDHLKWGQCDGRGDLLIPFYFNEHKVNFHMRLEATPLGQLKVRDCRKLVSLSHHCVPGPPL